MAASAIQPIGYTSPQFYRAAEYANSAYNEIIQQCAIAEKCWCTPAEMGDDICFQFKAETSGENLMSGANQVRITGTADGTTAGQLVDSTHDFDAELGGLVGWMVSQLNPPDTPSTFITGVGVGFCTVSDDIFVSGDQYAIWNWMATDTAWQIDTDRVCATNTAAELSFPQSLSSGGWYTITIEVANYVSGSLNVHFGAVTQPVIGTITGNGTYTFYGQQSGAFLGVTFAAPSGETFTGCMNLASFELYQLNQEYYIDFIDQDDVIQFSTMYNYTGPALSIGNIIFCDGPWSGYDIPEGCYRIRIAGNSNGQLGDLIRNGDFSDGSAWSFSDPNISITSGVLRFSGVPMGEYATEQMLFELQPNTTYCVTFEIPDYVTGGIIFNQGLIDSPVFTASGSWQFTTGSAPGIQFYIKSSQNGTILDVDNVTLEVCTAEGYVFDLISECICVADSVPCTTLLKWQNSEGNHAFGMYYGDPDYFNTMRVYADLMPGPLRDQQRNWHKGSTGNAKMTYADLLKVKPFAFEEMPEYVHNAVSTCFSHNTVLVDGVEYISISAIEGDWQPRRLLAPLIFDVAPVDQRYLTNTY